MLLEIRTYTLRPGVRDEFVSWFEAEVVPAMEATGMRIVGAFTSVEDPDVFVYLRAFTDAEERDRQYLAFYESPAWLDGMKARALELELGYEVRLVAPTASSRLH
jgi:hypothetical protein